jgi:hypothetical protein
VHLTSTRSPALDSSPSGDRRIRACTATPTRQLLDYLFHATSSRIHAAPQPDKDTLAAVIKMQATRVLEFQEPHLERPTSIADLRRWRDAVVPVRRARSER